MLSQVDNEVDLCQDVSYFGDPSYKDEECVICDTEFQTVEDKLLSPIK